MHRFRSNPWPLSIFGVAAMLLIAGAIAGLSNPRGEFTVNAAPPSTRPVDGLRQHEPDTFALTNARIVVASGRVIEQGTVVVRGDMIEAVGADVTIPAEARVIDLSGKTIYPGLIDAFSEVSIGDDEASRGAPHWNPHIVPQRRVAGRYQADKSLNEKLCSQGITLRLAAPSGGILRGTSAIVATGGDANDQAIVKSDVAQHIRLTVSRGSREQYPNSPMGAVALARQAMYDADWFGDAWQAWKASSSASRPEINDALAALSQWRDGDGLVVIDAINELYALRADDFAREFKLNAVLRGSGNEYRRLDAIRATGRPVLVPVAFPKAPNVATPEAARQATLESLMHWELAPENPARLQAAGIRIAICTHGLADVGSFLKSVRQAVDRGLSADDALRALTQTPAELYGIADRTGTVEAGKLANLIVSDNDLFADKTKVLETWVLGQRHEHTRDPLFDIRGQWTLKLAPKPSQGGDIALKIAGELSKLEGTSRPFAAKSKGKSKKPAEDEAGDKLKQVGLRDARFSALVEGKPWGHNGIAQLSLVLLGDGNSDLHGLGTITWPDGSQSRIEATRQANEDEKPEPSESDDKDSGDQLSNDKEADSSEKTANEPTPVVYPLGAFGAVDAPSMQQSGPQSGTQSVAFTNATIWTCGPDGILENATLLIRDGRIEAIGTDIEIPADVRVVNVEGKHITPGIIDCHSHMATDGGINESTQAVTAEVRIGDFVDSDDINIYRQLAGGVTSANILHGSANPIGGQNQVIKLRWGGLPEAMKFAEAPAGIKFALGENVKQSNWGERFTSRYPQTRMGVEQIIYDSFQTAHEYEQQWDRWRKSHRGTPPRRDLELDALVEILRGERWIHCHSYRQDEILALLRTLEEFHITIGSLQHILEGYKVADAMAQHGAMGSSFSDWWAYKFEVYDAIPYNGVLMHNAGVVVSFNSDDAELARHLNHEAAKAVKYGGVPAEEALKFVTLNPAKQLRIDTLVGSLEAGKHADFVIWSGPPLSTLSRCEQTWIDGRSYFDLKQDQQLRQRDRELKSRLIQKALRGDGPMLSPGESNSTEEELWPRVDIFCRASNHRQGR